MGAPTGRRKLLDLHIAQIDPLYVYRTGRCFKAVKQRNFLLRQKKNDGIEIWEQVMIGAATLSTKNGKISWKSFKNL